MTPFSEVQPQRQLHRSRIVDRGHLAEAGRWIRGECAGAEDAVQGHAVDVIGEVELFGQALQPQSFRDLEAAAQPGAYTQ